MKFIRLQLDRLAIAWLTRRAVNHPGFERAPNLFQIIFNKQDDGHRVVFEYVKPNKESSMNFINRYERLLEQLLQADEIPSNVKARIKGELL